MAITKISSRLFTGLRITKLDSCCLPLPTGTADAVLELSDEVFSATVSPVFEAREVTEKKNGKGVICLKSSIAPYVKELEVTLDFCSTIPEVAEALLGQAISTDAAGSVIGNSLTLNESLTNKVMVELWGEVPINACGGGVQLYTYLQLPCTSEWVNSADAQFNNDFLQFSLTGFATAGAVADIHGVLDNAPAAGYAQNFVLTSTAPPETSQSLAAA